jgi:amicyanin-dependent methylamine dehydrogenase small subunit
MIHFDADSLGEKVLRRFAGGTSRRGILARLGTALVAAPLFPVLPVSRANAAPAKPDRGPEAKTTFARGAQVTDNTKCDYWRYCAIDGALCTCCGGGVHTCPPGAEPSPSRGWALASIPKTASPTSSPTAIAAANPIATSAIATMPTARRRSTCRN